MESGIGNTCAAGNGHLLGVAAVLVECEHPLPHAQPRDPVADRNDITRGFVAQDVGTVRRFRIESLAREHVGEVDAGRADQNHHIVRSDRGLGALLEMQALGWPGLP